MSSDLCQWILVEAQLGRSSGRSRACLRGQRRSGASDLFEILPVLPNGRIHEVIRLPADVTNVSLEGGLVEPEHQASLKIRRLGWFERTWRMGNRVLNTFRRLSKQQRTRCGLTLGKVIFDLAGAYRIATQFRWGSAYSDWIEGFHRVDDTHAHFIRRHIVTFARPPHINVLLMVDGAAPGAIQATLDSLKQQLFRNFTCAVLDVRGRGIAGADFVGGLRDVGGNSCVVALPDVAAWLAQLNNKLRAKREWVMLLRPGDALSPDSLYWFASESLDQPKAAVLYSDDDKLDAQGQRCEPRFKPDWSLAHLRSTHFVGDAVVLRGAEVVKAGGITFDCCRHGNYDLLLRVIDAVGDEGAESVAHIPALLLHRGHAPLGGEGWNDTQWNIEKLREHLARNRVGADVSETIPGCWRVRYRLPEAVPMVSIIVPTRDALHLIRQCVDSLLSGTTYPRFEMLVVDNQSSDPETLAYLAQIAGDDRIRVLRYDRPFNYSAMNNMAAREARGEVLCLLNNDTEAISPDWLEEMVSHLLQTRVGVVGAKLFYPDGRVQHAGDTVGPGGCANHLHSLIERDDPGYCNRAMVAQELSAVTAACMVTWRHLYQSLRGLNEKRLTVAFNDVDYCLRVRKAGYRVVWTPHAELYHHESVSRGKDLSPRRRWRASRERAYMRSRWKQELRHDPFYNPNLSYECPGFVLSHVPNVERPWKKVS